MTSLAEIKDAARAAAFARRKDLFRARAAGDADLLSRVLADHPGAILSGYMPMRTEIDCLPAMIAHVAAGGRVCVPVIPGKAVPLHFHEWRPDAEMIEGIFGAKVPAGGERLEPTVLIVPLLSFDRAFYRLGYGGGYYDRTLELLRAKSPVTAIGFAFSGQEIPDVPVEPTDQKLDLIVTEREIIRRA